LPDEPDLFQKAIIDILGLQALKRLLRQQDRRNALVRQGLEACDVLRERITEWMIENHPSGPPAHRSEAGIATPPPQQHRRDPKPASAKR
jgi:hypothetical protein